MQSLYILLLLGLVCFVVEGKDVTCKRRRKQTVEIGDSSIFNVTNSKFRKTKCAVTYKKNPSCPLIRFTCSCLTICGFDIYNIYNIYNRCKGLDRMVLKTNNGTKKYCGMNAPDITTSGSLKVSYFSKKKSKSHATCKAECVYPTTTTTTTKTTTTTTKTTASAVVDPANIQSNPSLAGAIYTTGLSIYYSSGIEATISYLAQALNRSEDGISTTLAEIETFLLSISQNNETISVSEDNLLIQYLVFLPFFFLPPNGTFFNATVDNIISTGNLSVFGQTVTANYTNQESLIIQGEIAKSAGKFWKENGDILAPFQGPIPGNISCPWSWPLWPLFTGPVVLGAEAGFLVGGPVDAIIHSIGYTFVFLPLFVEEGFMKRTYLGNLTQHSALSAIIHSNSGLDLDISGRIHFGNLTSFNFYN